MTFMKPYFHITIEVNKIKISQKKNITYDNLVTNDDLVILNFEIFCNRRKA